MRSSYKAIYFMADKFSHSLSLRLIALLVLHLILPESVMENYAQLTKPMYWR